MSQPNLFNYSYKQGEMVEIPGELLYAIMQFSNTVNQNETHVGFSYQYSKSAKEIKENGLTVKVELDQKEYPSAASFMNQEPQKFTTMTGNAAMDILMMVQKIHKEYVDKGIAKPYGELRTEEAKETPVIKLS
jgi:hypothetical protein